MLVLGRGRWVAFQKFKSIRLTNVSINFRMTYNGRCIHRKLLYMLSWNRVICIFPKVTKMGSIFGHKIDHDGVGIPRPVAHTH